MHPEKYLEVQIQMFKIAMLVRDLPLGEMRDLLQTAIDNPSNVPTPPLVVPALKAFSEAMLGVQTSFQNLKNAMEAANSLPPQD